MTSVAEEPLTIAEAAERTGLSVDTLRYYERDGLMVAPPDRSATGHRRYTERHLGWIEMLTRLRSTGMPIRDVRRYAELARDGDATVLDRLELLREHRDHVLAQLAEATEHLGAINRKIGLYEGMLDLERTPGS